MILRLEGEIIKEQENTVDSLTLTRKGPMNLFEIERVQDRERKLGWNQWKGLRTLFEIEISLR